MPRYRNAEARSYRLSALLDNALEYTAPGGSIEVSVEERPGRVSVSDSGIGIPAGDTARRFERFRSVDCARPTLSASGSRS